MTTFVVAARTRLVQTAPFWRPVAFVRRACLKSPRPASPPARRRFHCRSPLNTTSSVPSAVAERLPDEEQGTQPGHRLRDFNLQGKVFVVTGGGRGLGLTLAEVLVEAGGKVGQHTKTRSRQLTAYLSLLPRPSWGAGR